MENISHINQITAQILSSAYKVHQALGPGLLESVYQECLYYELQKSGFIVFKEYPLPVIYEEVKMEVGYRADLFVENEVIVEIKSVEALTDVHLAQVLTYLKIANRQIGLLINFNVTSLKSGIRRIYNKYYTP